MEENKNNVDAEQETKIGLKEENLESSVNDVETKEAETTDVKECKKKKGIIVAISIIVILAIAAVAVVFVLGNNNPSEQKDTGLTDNKANEMNSEVDDNTEATQEVVPTVEVSATTEPTAQPTTNPETPVVPEGATLVDMDTLNKDYYVLLENGKDWCVDLNGDGTYEVLRYDCVFEDDYISKVNLSINGKQDEEISSNYYESPWSEFAVVDLDNTDNEYQIAVLENGPSDDPGTYFYKYNNCKLELIDSVYDTINGMSFNIDNTPGKFSHGLRVDAICSTYITDYMQYNKSTKTMDRVDVEYYEYMSFKEENGERYGLNLLKDLNVYAEDDKTSEKSVIKAQEVYLEKVKFTYGTREDSEYETSWEVVESYWVYMTAEDGTAGWIQVERDFDAEYFEVVDGVNLEEYFGMLYAG